MTKNNLILETVSILEVINQIKEIRLDNGYALGADKLRMEQDAVNRLMSLLSQYPFETVIDFIEALSGAA